MRGCESRPTPREIAEYHRAVLNGEVVFSGGFQVLWEGGVRKERKISPEEQREAAVLEARKALGLEPSEQNPTLSDLT